MDSMEVIDSIEVMEVIYLIPSEVKNYGIYDPIITVQSILSLHENHNLIESMTFIEYMTSIKSMASIESPLNLRPP